jgi:menaquinone-dependent protoporphyrinogen oxidase
MSLRTLVTYGSRYGSTAEVAERIGLVLGQAGLDVVVLPVSEVADAAAYQAFVIGSAVYSGEWSPDVNAFINQHQGLLRAAPVALFCLALRLRLDDEAMRTAVLQVFTGAQARTAPQAIGLFAGTLHYERLSPIVRLQLKTKNLPEGDFRDWAAIEGWAASLPAALAGDAADA